MFDEMPKKEKRVIGLRENEKMREWWQGVEQKLEIGFESEFFGAFSLEKGAPSIQGVPTSKESDVLLCTFEALSIYMPWNVTF